MTGTEDGNWFGFNPKAELDKIQELKREQCGMGTHTLLSTPCPRCGQMSLEGIETILENCLECPYHWCTGCNS